MLTDEQRRFLETERVARFATVDADGQPHVVPICYALIDDSIFFTIDEKPKRTRTGLKRLANIRSHPKVALVVDRYDEDWSKLAWVMIQGDARILREGDLHRVNLAVQGLNPGRHHGCHGPRQQNPKGAAVIFRQHGVFPWGAAARPPERTR